MTSANICIKSTHINFFGMCEQNTFSDISKKGRWRLFNDLLYLRDRMYHSFSHILELSCSNSSFRVDIIWKKFFEMFEFLNVEVCSVVVTRASVPFHFRSDFSGTLLRWLPPNCIVFTDDCCNEAHWKLILSYIFLKGN